MITAGKTMYMVLLCGLWCACSPRVTSFTVYPAAMITKDDSVKFNWKVSGKPTLLFYQEDNDDQTNAGTRLLSFKLVAQKGRREAFLLQTLTLLPDTSTHEIRMKSIRNGNELFAIDTLDRQKWGTYFKLDLVNAQMKRPLTVIHGGRTVQLDAAGHSSAGFKGLPNSGPWEIRTSLTAAEISGEQKLPGHLFIQTRVIHQKE
jgi:hypothetical protein